VVVVLQTKVVRDVDDEGVCGRYFLLALVVEDS
jgi:hypothetical protein